MRMLTADQEITRLTQERDEAKVLVAQYRAQVLQLEARASRAEGEAAAQSGTISALTQALELLHSEQEKSALLGRIAELEKEITQCLTRMTGPPPVVLQERGKS